jgi:hypothetical protein
MTSEECHQRAADCAASAGMSRDLMVASEFMTLAAHWRAMAVRETFLGHVADPVEASPPSRSPRTKGVAPAKKPQVGGIRAKC